MEKEKQITTAIAISLLVFSIALSSVSATSPRVEQNALRAIRATFAPSPQLASDNPLSYMTHWYAGSSFIGKHANASELLTSLATPSTSPRSDEFYYVLASIWDNNGSYDQIGYSDDYGVWGLTYSWTSGPCNQLKFHYNPDAMNLNLSTNYKFYIVADAKGGIDFKAFVGSRLVWSLHARNSATKLEVEQYYCGYYDYTDYEEVWQTHFQNGHPNFNFYFPTNQYYVKSWTAATWTTFYVSSPPGVIVYIKLQSVRIHNRS
jgi:hypothetical protein